MWFVALVSWALATPPLAVQGLLTGPDGQPLDGTRAVTFRLYASADQPSAEAPFQETATLGLSSGLFTAFIGQTSAIPEALLQDDLWLGIELGGVESTRTPVGWAPRAAWAAQAGDAATLEGEDLAALESRFDGRYAPLAGGSGYVSINPPSAQDGDVSLLGSLSAGSLFGDGSGISGLDMNNVASGLLGVLYGGTGASTPADARANLGAAASGQNSDITSLTGLTTALGLSFGGTGATSAAGARSNLGAAASGANADITSLTGLTTALGVALGGTGRATLSANGLLVGNGTGAVVSLSTGNSGQVLTSAGSGSTPTWSTPAAAGFPTDSSGSTSCTTAGTVRWTGTRFQGCNGTTWVSMDTGPAVTTPGTVVYAFTAGDQMFKVPADVTSVTVKMWGAGGGGGGAGGWNEGFRGGGGGYTTGTISVTPGETLTVVVGQGGDYRFPNGLAANYGGGGGFAYPHDTQYGASGGGRSAIRRSGSELLTAGGGGGGGSRANAGPAGSNAGGAGGGLTGAAASQNGGTPAQGGGSATGGNGGTAANSNGTAGGFLTGGRPGANSYGGGGGGGYYGGGGGGYQEPGVMGGGGGGSSYISGSGVSGASTLAGSGPTPANAGDAAYLSGGGVGGLIAGRGGDGLVVVTFSSALPAPPPQTVVPFSYTGSNQSWTVPAGVTEITVKAWGAGGGGGGVGGWHEGFRGGAGGFTTARMSVTPGEVLTVMVGQGGEYRFPNGQSANYGGGGGNASNSDNQYGASGGGRSAIRRSTTDIVTAGGGGGGGSRANSGPAGSNAGGAGGGNDGERGYQNGNTPSVGGSQIAGGAGASGANAAGVAGSLYTGGRPGVNSYGGGGGGGYYGGGGGGYQEPGIMGGGSGGSGYIGGALWGTMNTGWQWLAPGTGDVDYAPGVAAGAPIAGTGGPGRVVIRY
jgi:hypothetical protein